MQPVEACSGGVHKKSVQSLFDFIRFDTLSPYSPYSYHK